MSKELKARVAALEAEVAELHALVDGDEDDDDGEDQAEREDVLGGEPETKPSEDEPPLPAEPEPANDETS